MDESIQKYKNELEVLILKSQEIFERQLNYISAGAIGISFAFIEKLTGSLNDASCKALLFSGWIALIASLVLNLISHLKAKKLHYLTINEINKETYQQENVLMRNKILDKYNYWTIFLTIFGIVLILLFVTLNVI
jgi:hypothetical protein